METVGRKNLTAEATKHVTDIVTLAIEHDASKKMLVIYDTDDELTNIITSAYKQAFPDASYIDFGTVDKEVVLTAMADLHAEDLVVLVQSADFRLSEFRIRLHLFERDIKVIDHRHLMRNTPDSYPTYIAALGYDPEWYRGVGHALKSLLTETKELTLYSKGCTLTVTGGLEEPKPNLGDYRGMKNTGGTFPIGEVFTEAKDLYSVNGSVMIYSFADVDFNIAMHEPFRIDITDGLVTGWSENAPQSFVDVIEKIKTNERALMREIGFGLNRAITREHYIKDITAFERILGLHISLGEKHTVYKKEGIRAKKTRFHVDVFLDVDKVEADGREIFRDREYTFMK